MRTRLVVILALVLAGVGMFLSGQSRRRAVEHAPARESGHETSVATLTTTLHAFLNRTLGWQGLDSIKIESISAPDPSGLRTAKVLLTKGAARQEATYYITADGREVLEGQLSRLSADPWAGVRAKIQTKGAPVEGAADAPVTLVEFSDLECPYCKEEAGSLSKLMQDDPGKVRIVFKYFPLTKIHPWSMQAAIAAACVTQQHPAQFWNFAQTVFADQDQINPTNAAQRLEGIAEESEANPTAYTACIASPAAKRTVEASIANGKELGVTSTPTMFVDGRMIPGAVQESQLQELVDFEAKIKTEAAGSGLAGHMAGPQCGGGCGTLPPLPSKKK